jgi:hypothetical protein
MLEFSRATVPRKTSPVHAPCSPAPSVPAPARRALESPSDPPALSRWGASLDTATEDRSVPDGLTSARRCGHLSCASPINRTLCACATITSCPNSVSIRLIHGECIPVSSAMRQRAAPQTRPGRPSASCSVSAPGQSSPLRSARSTSSTDPPDPIRSSVSPRRFLFRNIPALLHRRGANLFHCRSPSYLCLEHVDNLGAYTASRP